MHERMLTGFLAAAFLLAPAYVGAQEESDPDEEDYYSRPGAYFQALFTNNIGGYAFPSYLENDAQYSTGVGGALGYRFQKHVAAEVYGDWVAGWNVQAPGTNFGDAVAGAIGINAKGYLSGGRFQPYGLLGLGAAYSELIRSTVPGGEIEWDMALRIGVGFDFYATEDLGFTFAPMWVRPLGVGDDLEDLEYVSIGIGAFIRLGGE